MNPEEKRMLQKAVELAEDNNRMLHKMRRAVWWGVAYRVFYWVIILGLSLGAYYYIQPYVDQVRGVYGGAKDTVSNVKNISSLLKNLE